jgi:hypothetical protein
MDANHSTALLAFPSVPLPGNEALESELSYAMEVPDHAHAVFHSVAFVQLGKSSAGERIAFEAKLLLAYLSHDTVPDSAHDTVL